MTNTWITRVTGQPLAEAAPTRKFSTLRKVLGEADEEKGEQADDKPEKPDKAEPDKKESPKADAPPAPATDKPEGESGGGSEPPPSAEGEAGAEPEADSGVDSQAVAGLVSSWQSGSRMDVAAQLMYTPVNYVDFVKMILRIGEQDAVELGGMLDQLSEVRPSIDQPGGQPGQDGQGQPPEAPQGGSANRILSRIAQRRQQEQPVAQPAGETGPELDTAP